MNQTLRVLVKKLLSLFPNMKRLITGGIREERIRQMTEDIETELVKL